MSRAPAGGRRGARRPRHGLTLIEIMVSMVILVGVVMVLGSFGVRFGQANSQTHLVVTANQLAADRLDLIRTQQATYDAIGPSLAGVESVRADNTTFAVRTVIKRVGGTGPTDVEDYKLITVTVTHPTMRQAVRKTTAVAAF